MGLSAIFNIILSLVLVGLVGICMYYAATKRSELGLVDEVERERQKYSVKGMSDFIKHEFDEITRMKEEYNIEWCQDLFWKCWKIKEGANQFEALKKFKGEQLAIKRVNTLKDIGGIEFLSLLQKEVYPVE